MLPLRLGQSLQFTRQVSSVLIGGGPLIGFPCMRRYSGSPNSPPTSNTAFSPSQELPQSTIPIFTSLQSFRKWRRDAFAAGKTVGFVPTMGALHDGHISLVRESLANNDLTVLSIFVNPAQFAPHEDLATYPRTLESDLDMLSKVSVSGPGASIRTPSAVFLPPVKDMYPSGIVLDVDQQKGTFIEVKGYGDQMEGKSRPAFFRGVATVVTKLFNAVEPTSAYFGQKDIQQGLLLKRLARDLLLSHPTPENLHIVPTYRTAPDNLALSSRNAYLNEAERAVAGTLFAALKKGEEAWREGLGRKGCLERALAHVQNVKETRCDPDGINMQLDYIEMNDPESFEIVDRATQESDGRPVILSGALWVGRTRLIDNIILGDSSHIIA